MSLSALGQNALRAAASIHGPCDRTSTAARSHLDAGGLACNLDLNVTEATR